MAANIISHTHSHRTRYSPDNEYLRFVRFCPACNEHEHTSPSKCRLNIAPRCSRCNLYGHNDARSTCCKFNKNYILPEVERTCCDCDKPDHLSKRSNLCELNPNSPFYKNQDTVQTDNNSSAPNEKTSRSQIQCKSCLLFGHSTTRSMHCLKNPKRTRNNDTNTTPINLNIGNQTTNNVSHTNNTSTHTPIQQQQSTQRVNARTFRNNNLANEINSQVI